MPSAGDDDVSAAGQRLDALTRVAGSGDRLGILAAAPATTKGHELTAERLVPLLANLAAGTG